MLANIFSQLGDPNWVIADFTVVLALSTIGLWIVTWRAGVRQSRDMQASISVARQSADAATLSAKAAIGIELPIIRPVVEDIDHLEAPIKDEEAYSTVNLDGAPYRYSALAAIDFKNFGRTLAFPTKLELGWRAMERLPESPVYDGKTILLSHSSVIRPEESYGVQIHATIELSDAEQKAIRDDRSYLWLYGSLHFRDFLNFSHEARFCWRRCRRDQFGHHSFGSDGEPPSEYIRQT